MRKFNNDKIVSLLSAVLAIVIFYAILQAFGITCPIKYLFGISCPGCGMTRSWISILHLDFAKAFYYHPLFWIPPLFILILFFKSKIQYKFYKGFIFTIVALFVIVYLYRLISGNSTVVTCDIKNGLLFRLINKIT